MQGWFNIWELIIVFPHTNRLKKKKKYMVISKNGETAFNKTQHSLLIKILRKLAIEGNFLDLIKNVTNKL